MQDKDLLIDKYLMGELTLSEKKAFEKQMEEDDELFSEVLFRRDLIVAVHISARHKLEELLEKKEKEKKSRPISGKIIVFFILLFAILTLLLIFAFKIFS